MPNRSAISCEPSSARSARGASGTTRCAVSAVSVVLIGQMWRWWTATTPGSLSSDRVTASGSMPAGTAWSAIASASRSSPQVPARITATTTRLVDRASSQVVISNACIGVHDSALRTRTSSVPLSSAMPFPP